MSDPGQPGPIGAEDLQFDEAEFGAETETEAEAEAPRCAACQHEIAEEYYELNGKIICANCRAVIASGSGWGLGFVRLVRAVIFGTGAAVLGSAIYYGFTRLTGAEWSLISILVGFLVGGAVRRGTHHRGGLVYQLLAVFLTYTAIVTSYAALAFPEVVADFDKRVVAGPPAPAPPGVAAVPQAKPTGAGRAVFLVIIAVFLLAVSYTAPFHDVSKNIIGLAIILFALWEAWKLNQKARLVIRGPFQLGGADVGGDVAPWGLPGHA